MNIFFLDPDPDLCAQAHVTKHVSKMLVESCQLMNSAYSSGPYKATHSQHPCACWTRASKANFEFVLNHAKALLKEYKYRYENRYHKCEEAIKFFEGNPPKIIEKEFTNPPRCFGEFSSVVPVTSCIYEDYRNYYKMAKSKLFHWKGRESPNWL